jgi:UDP-N-acetyl-D-glucosamine dehydrogenase
MDLKDKISARTARIGVIGLGYVGLPLAVEFAKAGFQVTGFDVDESKVTEINAGRSYILDVATDDVAACVKKGTLCATTDMARLHDMDVVDICVPTPLRKTRDPDLSYVVQAVDAVKARLKPGQLIILESTTCIPARRMKSCSRPSRRAGSRQASTSTWPSRPSASTRATSGSAPGRFPRWSAG